MTREIEEFKPLADKQVRMYTCGPTVWNYPHIGNYRTFVFEDLLRRYLEYRGYKVTQVMNLTDVDDRIIDQLRKEEEGKSLKEYTEKYAKSFFEDLEFLRVERAEYYPRATDNIPEMVKIIEGLLDMGYAYKSDDGSIYYKISSFPSYGKLSGLKLTELKPGARVNQDDYDKDAAQDFALWKSWDQKDGNVFWDTTSLGRGRPGWHIECSAMSMKYLGEEFDIHTGGVDNKFPHHENEIAQSEAYTKKPLARYWLHAEHLLVNDQKMAKRLGNFITIKQLRDRGMSGAALRLLLLSAQYRTQQNFTEAALEQASASVKRIDEFVLRLEEAQRQETPNSEKKEKETSSSPTSAAEQLISKTRESFVSALDEDLDTPRALAAVFGLITEGNKLLDSGAITSEGARQLLGFMLRDFDPIFSVLTNSLPDETELPEDARALLRERELTRKNKDWKTSDALRSRLGDLGIEVQDTPQGQKWRRRKTPVSL